MNWNMQKYVRRAQDARRQALLAGQQPIYKQMGYEAAGGPGNVLMGFRPAPQQPPTPGPTGRRPRGLFGIGR